MKKYLIILIILTACNKSSRVYVTGKAYVPEHPSTYTNEQYCLFIKRVDGTTFFINSKERIVQTDRESYNKIKIGDTLKNQY